MLKITLKIKKINDEYVVQWIENNIIDEGKSYYTDCKKDAEETKQAMIDAYNKTNFTNVLIK